MWLCVASLLSACGLPSLGCPRAASGGRVRPPPPSEGGRLPGLTAAEELLNGLGAGTTHLWRRVGHGRGVQAQGLRTQGDPSLYTSFTSLLTTFENPQFSGKYGYSLLCPDVCHREWPSPRSGGQAAQRRGAQALDSDGLVFHPVCAVTSHVALGKHLTGSTPQFLHLQGAQQYLPPRIFVRIRGPVQAKCSALVRAWNAPATLVYTRELTSLSRSGSKPPLSQSVSPPGFSVISSL